MGQEGSKSTFLNLHQLRDAFSEISGAETGFETMTEQEAPAGITSLPDETLLQILGYLKKEEMQLLHPLVVSCRRLNSVFTPYLYDAVQLTMVRAIPLARTFSDKPEYCQSVKSIRIGWSLVSTPNVSYRARASEALEEILARCTELEEFVCTDHTYESYPSPRSLRSLQGLTKLKTIEASANVEVLIFFPVCLHVETLILNESMNEKSKGDLSKAGSLRYIFPSTRYLEVRRRHFAEPEIGRLYWSIWRALTCSDTFIIDIIGLPNATRFVGLVKHRLRHVSVEINNATHFSNLRIELDLTIKTSWTQSYADHSFRLIFCLPIQSHAQTRKFQNRLMATYRAQLQMAVHLIAISASQNVVLELHSLMDDTPDQDEDVQRVNETEELSEAEKMEGELREAKHWGENVRSALERDTNAVVHLKEVTVK